jgi:hypothetical protein
MDSLALREFLGLVLPEAPPDHSTISRTRRLIALETHQAVFTCNLQRLADARLVKGKTVGIDARRSRASIDAGGRKGRTTTGRIRMSLTQESRR